MDTAWHSHRPGLMDCGGKRSATPLSGVTGFTSESGVASALCHRSPNPWNPRALCTASQSLRVNSRPFVLWKRLSSSP